MNEIGLPLVSVIIPCYNQAQYLSEAIESVIAQTYTSWECIVVNDGSPDNTINIANSFTRIDSRITLFTKNTNEGLAAARNSGIALSKGEYILPLDADDVLAPTYISKSLQVFYDSQKVKVVYTDVWEFGTVNRLVVRDDVIMKRLCSQNIFQPTALFRKSDFLKTDGYRNNVFGYEDWDMWLQLIENASDAHRISEHLFGIRVKAESMITELLGNPEKERNMRWKVMQNNKKRIEKWAPEQLPNKGFIHTSVRIFKFMTNWFSQVYHKLLGK